MSAHPLVFEAERLLDQEPLDPSDIVDLARRCRTHPPDDPAAGRVLLSLIETLTRRAAAELQSMERSLKQSSVAKKALSGYGSVKPQKRNQHANKVV